jgi:hypothetical protein
MMPVAAATGFNSPHETESLVLHGADACDPSLIANFTETDHGFLDRQESRKRRGINHFRQLNVVLDAFTDLLPP